VWSFVAFKELCLSWWMTLEGLDSSLHQGEYTAATNMSRCQAGRHCKKLGIPAIVALAVIADVFYFKRWLLLLLSLFLPDTWKVEALLRQ